MPEYFERYIRLVKEEDLFEAFERSIHEIKNLDTRNLEALRGKTYEEGKWQVNDILQHLADTERLLSAGALKFMQGETDYRITFDENEMARRAQATEKKTAEIRKELLEVRLTTFKMFKNFRLVDFTKSGINWKHRITVGAMGFNIIGHQIHHFKVIEEKYLNL